MAVTIKQWAKIFVALTDELEGKALERAAQAFVEILDEKQIRHKAMEIIREIDGIWKEKHGAANVDVKSAHPLPPDLRKRLKTAVKGASFTEQVSPDLIGGARIRIDDRILDGSIKGKLEALKKAWINA